MHLKIILPHKWKIQILKKSPWKYQLVTEKLQLGCIRCKEHYICNKQHINQSKPNQNSQSRPKIAIYSAFCAAKNGKTSAGISVAEVGVINLSVKPLCLIVSAF